MSARRGPYRKHTRIRVEKATWEVGDIVQVDRTRWIIQSIAGADVVLTASNHVNHGIRWDTTLDHLPERSKA